MKYPRTVYKDGGKIQRAGGFYSDLLVHDESDHSEAIKAGWYDNLQDAVDGKAPEVVKEDDAPPTRAELEAKAQELGLTFHHKTGDAKLASLIKQAMEA